MNPLVSCIMPTWNRRPFIRAAIQSFLDQTYEPRELVVIDDGDDKIEDLIPDDPRISYAVLSGRVSTGVKRNLCCEAAKGEVICHTDDDDWAAPNRIAEQVERLIKTGRPITGYGTLLFWDRNTKQAKRYHSRELGYVCGTSLMYLRSFWQRHQFKDQQEASDNSFVRPVRRVIAAADGTTKLVARIHDCHHTSSKKNITEVVPKSMIPNRFWDNESLLTP
jgi:O-antigen biosynthesis protein